MKNKLTFLFLLVLTMTSCQKDKFPELKHLQGKWKEVTDNSFKHELRFENDIMYFIRSNSIDTLVYRLDDKEEKMFLRLKNQNTETQTQHKILVNKKRDQITFWNLFITIGAETETSFKKE
jgi:hypothetical protein